MNHLWKRIAGLTLAMAMVSSLLPASALVVEETPLPEIPLGDEIVASPAGVSDELPLYVPDAESEDDSAQLASTTYSYLLATDATLPDGNYQIRSIGDGARTLHASADATNHCGNPPPVGNELPIGCGNDHIWVLTAVTGGYTIKSVSQNKYLSQTASGSQLALAATDSPAVFQITKVTDGYQITWGVNSDKKYLNFNNGWNGSATATTLQVYKGQEVELALEIPTLPDGTQAYLRHTGALENGVYAIYTNDATDDNNRILYHTGTGVTDRLTGSVSNSSGTEQLSLNSTNADFTAARQTWNVSNVTNVGNNQYSCTLQNVDSGRYLDLTSASSSGITTSATAVTLTITETSNGVYTVSQANGKSISFPASQQNYFVGDTAAELRFFKDSLVYPVKTLEEMWPKPGTTTNQPFPSGTGGSTNYRIPAIITLKHQSDTSKNGRIVAAIDARWNTTADAGCLDTILSYSDDDGATWNYNFPNYFGDTADTYSSSGTAFIDPQLTEALDGTIYLLVDIWPGGVALNSADRAPDCATGYVDVNGTKRMALYLTISGQTDENYDYYVGDFEAVQGSDDKYATIYKADGTTTDRLYLDEYYYLYQQTGDTRDPENDKIYCERIGSNDWVHQNVFFKRASLHVRYTSHLWIVKSTDGGATWSKPILNNDQVRTGENRFYGVGPGAGLCVETNNAAGEIPNGTILMPTYINEGEIAGFIYTTDDGATWHRGNNASRGGQSSESCIVQLNNTTVRQFFRDSWSNSGVFRYTDHTWDPAANENQGGWITGELEQTTDIPRYGPCQMSALRYSQDTESGEPVILLSAPTNSGARKNGKVYAAKVKSDGSMAQIGVYEINGSDENYAYSSITETRDGDIAVLYENTGTNVPFVIIPYPAILLGGAVDKATALNDIAYTYTEESWNALTAALTPAQTALAGSDKEAMNSARIALQTALDGLVKRNIFVKGTVSSSEGTLEGAVVTLVTADSGHSAVTGAKATTAADGTYSMNVNTVPAGSYQVRFSKAGYNAVIETATVTIVADRSTNEYLDHDATLTAITGTPTYHWTFDGADTPDENDLNTGSGAHVAYTDGEMKLTWDNANRDNNLVSIANTDMKNGIIEFDARRVNPSGARDGRFGLSIRTRTAGSNTYWIYIGQENNNNIWGTEFFTDSSGADWSYIAAADNTNPLTFGGGDTRHFKITIEDGSITLEMDGNQILTRTFAYPNFMSAGDVGFTIGNNKWTDIASEIYIDNLYVFRTDPKKAVALTAPGDGKTLTGTYASNGQTHPITGAQEVPAGDTVTVSGVSPDGKTLGGLTFTKTSGSAALSAAETAALNLTQVKGDNNTYSYTFTMPAFDITVSAVFKTPITGVTISGDEKVNKTLTASVKAGETDVPAAGATYQWSHQNTDGTWQTCTDGNAQTKTVKTADLGKKVKVRAQGIGDYTGWVEAESAGIMAQADVVLNGVSFARANGVTLLLNGSSTDTNTDQSIVGGTETILRAILDPNNATVSGYTWSVVHENGDPWADQDIITLSEVEQQPAQRKVTAHKTGTVWVKVQVVAGTLADNASDSAILPITVTKRLESIKLQKNGVDVGSDPIIIYANTNAELAAVADAATANRVNTVDLTAVLTPSDAIGVILDWTRPAGATGGIRVARSSSDSKQATISVQGVNNAVGDNSQIDPTLVRNYVVTVKPSTAATPSATLNIQVRRYVSRPITISIQDVNDSTAAPQIGQTLVADIPNLVMTQEGKDALTYKWYRLASATEGISGKTPVKTGVGSAGKTYPLTLADKDSFLAVEITADPSTFYEGSESFTRPQAVVKADGPAAPSGLDTTAPTEEGGVVTVTGLQAGKSYQYKEKDTENTWAELTAATELTSGKTYLVRIAENDTTKAGAEASLVTRLFNDTRPSVIIASDLQNGSLSAPNKAAAGTEVTVTVSPADGYELDALSVKDASGRNITPSGAGNAWTFTMPEQDVTVSATFKIRMLTIDHSGLVGLRCSLSDTLDHHQVQYGSRTAITLIAETGYALPTSTGVGADDLKVTDAEGNSVTGVSYDPLTGVLTITGGVTKDLYISGKGVPATYAVSYKLENGLYSSNTSHAVYGEDFVTTFAVQTESQGSIEMPDSVTVTYTDSGTKLAASQYSYSKTTGTITVKAAAVTGKLTITAAGKTKTFPVEGVTLRGNSTVGQTLTASSVTPSGATVSYQWERASTAQGSYTAIANAKSSYYELVDADLGQFIRLTVTGISPYTGSVSSEPKGPVSAQVIEAEGVTITAPSSTLPFGHTMQLTATVTPENATADTVKWASLDESVATVDENTGVVTPVAVGSVTIRAAVVQSDGETGVTDTCTITIERAPISVTISGDLVESRTLTAVLSPAGLTANDLHGLFWYRIGDNGEEKLDNDASLTYTLTADDIGHRIKVVADNATGNYTGTAEALTDRAITAFDDTVFASDVLLDKSAVTLSVGAKTTLHATIEPSDATNQTVFWASDNEAVATVNENGQVTGVAEGTAVITVTSEDGGYVAACTVTVTKASSRPSGSSSSTSTATETRDDGSKVTTVTKPDGSVTETVEQPDGTKSETVTTKNGDVTITVTDENGEKLVKAEIPATIPEPETKFEDVDVTPWAEEAIHKMAGLELVNGTGNNKYSPVAPMTRGSLATVLHRLSQGKTDYESTFKDVAQGKYYTEGVAWAAKAKVVTGYTADIFAPDDVITREQLAVMLCRYAKLIGMDTKADSKALDKFADGNSTGDWAVDGVAWCVEKGILKGKGQNNLDPTANVTRAEVAVMLDRFIALIK